MNAFPVRWQPRTPADAHQGAGLGLLARAIADAEDLLVNPITLAEALVFPARFDGARPRTRCLQTDLRVSFSLGELSCSVHSCGSSSRKPTLSVTW